MAHFNRGQVGDPTGPKPETTRTGSKTGRRQYRSCDQCRKGKRACDIVIADDGEPLGAGPCSTCAKTGKLCTLNWLRSTQEAVWRGERNSIVKTTGKNAMDLRQDKSDPHDVRKRREMYSELSPASGISEGRDLPPSPPLFSPYENSEGLYSPYSSRQPTIDDTMPDLDLGLFYHQVLSPSVCGGAYIDSNVSIPIPLEFTSLTTDLLPPVIRESPSEERTAKRRRQRYPVSNTRRSPDSRATRPARVQQSSSFSSQYSPLPTDPSSDTLEYRLAAAASKSFISSGLMKIYHDTMENALSCWLTERTCPYDDRVQSSAFMHAWSFDSGDPMTREWGSDWTNRICERVCRLDRASSSLRSTPLTLSEDRAVRMALKTTIMAFATQWAHSSNRSAAEYSSLRPKSQSENYTRASDNDFACLDPIDPDLNDSESSSATEFDRCMQETFWNQARKALCETAGIESFRVIFAHLIFSLTQKPLDVDRRVQEVKTRRSSSFGTSENSCPFDSSMGMPCVGTFDCESVQSSTHSTGGNQRSGLDELEQVLELDGPPIFLETALRQIHSYRCKLEKAQSIKRAYIDGNMAICNQLGSSIPASRRTDPLDFEDRQTFNLLFWLAVMFDTLSAAINKRPPVVSDEDSDILQDPASGMGDTEKEAEQNLYQDGLASFNTATLNLAPPKDSDSNIWGRFFLTRDTGQHRQGIIRWPCSYEKAAATLCDAAPIKVLFFRKVTRLQTLISRRCRHEKLEMAINDALVIYEYWNSKYGLFIQDCISSHESLNSRIQSWYIILAGHWHLAGLLLADIIEEVDMIRMGLETHRAFRNSTALVVKLRMKDSYAVSDLARCSCPRRESSFQRAKEFHVAVNRGALLTEPWTEVLVRSFSKAAAVLLDMLPEYESSWDKDTMNTKQFTDRCELCIEALWHLGKKSDIALLASTVLSKSLKEKNELLRASNLPFYSVFEDKEVEGEWNGPSGIQGYNFDHNGSFPSGFMDNSLESFLNSLDSNLQMPC